MTSFLQKLLRPAIPETTRTWSHGQWESWLKQAAHAYFASSDPAAKRAAMAPFTVEPLSDVPASAQLLREVRKYAPSAEAKLAAAVLDATQLWSARDGRDVGRFFARLACDAGGLVPKEALPAALQLFIAKVGPPLNDREIADLLQDAVDASMERVTPPVLRNLAGMIARRSYEWRLSPWRAQLRLFQALLRIEGAEGFFRNLQICMPDRIGLHQNKISGRYFADVVVDGLGLRAFRDLQDAPMSDLDRGLLTETRLLVFAYRVKRTQFSWTDLLHGEALILPASAVEQQTVSDAISTDADVNTIRDRMRHGAFDLVSLDD